MLYLAKGPQRKLWAGLSGTATVVALSVAPGTAQAASASAVPTDCPTGVTCVVVPAALNDSGCNYSPANRPTDTVVLGVHEHTTEGTLQQALDEAQDTNNCVSWNYLVGRDGTLYVSVAAKDYAYDVGNWWANTHYEEVENVGTAKDDPPLTPAQYRTNVTLVRYLAKQFHFVPSAAMVNGHDSMPAVNDTGGGGMYTTTTKAGRHWDPGPYFPWRQFLTDVGGPIVPTAGPNARVVTIRPQPAANGQPILDCPGFGYTGCVVAASNHVNYVTLYAGPSTSAPLVTDPYLPATDVAGLTAMQYWGNKALTGHSYVVIKRQRGWTEIWYAGHPAWFQDDGTKAVGVTALTVTPKSMTAVPVYGRPLPEATADWQDVPKVTQVPFSQYALQPGQQYAVVPVAAPDDYAQGCDNLACDAPGDGKVVHGATRYFQISFGHHYAFVKADDVTVGLA